MLPATPALKRCRACETSSAASCSRSVAIICCATRDRRSSRAPSTSALTCHADPRTHVRLPYHRSLLRQPAFAPKAVENRERDCTATWSCAERGGQRHAAQSVIASSRAAARRSDEIAEAAVRAAAPRASSAARSGRTATPAPPPRCESAGTSAGPAGRQRVGERDRRPGSIPNARARSIWPVELTGCHDETPRASASCVLARVDVDRRAHARLLLRHRETDQSAARRNPPAGVDDGLCPRRPCVPTRPFCALASITASDPLPRRRLALRGAPPPPGSEVEQRLREPHASVIGVEGPMIFGMPRRRGPVPAC